MSNDTAALATPGKVPAERAYVTVLLEGLNFFHSFRFFCSKSCAQSDPTHATFMREMAIPYVGEHCRRCGAQLGAITTERAARRMVRVIEEINAKATKDRNNRENAGIREERKHPRPQYRSIVETPKRSVTITLRW
jgi:hypothetical protein